MALNGDLRKSEGVISFSIKAPRELVGVMADEKQQEGGTQHKMFRRQTPLKNRHTRSGGWRPPGANSLPPAYSQLLT